MLSDKPRPCTICNYTTNMYEEVMFHGFFVEQYLVDASPMIGGHNGGQISTVLALIETYDGEIKKVQPTSIIFSDKGGKQGARDKKETVG